MLTEIFISESGSYLILKNKIIRCNYLNIYWQLFKINSIMLMKKLNQNKSNQWNYEQQNCYTTKSCHSCGWGGINFVLFNNASAIYNCSAVFRWNWSYSYVFCNFDDSWSVSCWSFQIIQIVTPSSPTTNGIVWRGNAHIWCIGQIRFWTSCWFTLRTNFYKAMVVDWVCSNVKFVIQECKLSF